MLANSLQAHTHALGQCAEASVAFTDKVQKCFLHKQMCGVEIRFVQITHAVIQHNADLSIDALILSLSLSHQYIYGLFLSSQLLMKTQSRDTMPSLRRSSSKHVKRSWPKSTHSTQVTTHCPGLAMIAQHFCFLCNCLSLGQ